MDETAATTLYRMAWTTKKDKDSFIREVYQKASPFWTHVTIQHNPKGVLTRKLFSYHFLLRFWYKAVVQHGKIADKFCGSVDVSIYVTKQDRETERKVTLLTTITKNVTGLFFFIQ